MREKRCEKTERRKDKREKRNRSKTGQSERCVETRETGQNASGRSMNKKQDTTARQVAAGGKRS